MRVLVACEFSGIVRDAFISRGHDAISVDLLPTERPGPHLEADLYSFASSWWSQFDLMVAHPPCTHLASSGARHFWRKEQEQAEALDFVAFLMTREIPKWALENPIGIISTSIRLSDQVVQPWMFGHEESKATCLWLEGLPRLKPTLVVARRSANLTPTGQNNVPGGPNQWRTRSRTYTGLADAMVLQWG